MKLENVNKKCHVPVNVHNNTPLVSIIVASHRSEWITQLCDILLDLDFDRSDYEIIIVSDYQCDTFQGNYINVKWVYICDTSISVKRNVGINYARGAIIAFTDDDCIPSRDWIRSGVEYLQKSNQFCGVEGFTSIEVTNRSGRMSKEYERLERPGFRTNNVFYHTTDLKEAGLFDTRFSVQREDVDIAFTLISMGKLISYCKDIHVIHRFRSNERWDLLKNCWNRRFDPLLYKKHSQLYRKHIQSPFPRTLLVLTFLWILLPIVIVLDPGYAVAYTVIVFVSLSILGLQRTGHKRFTFKNVASEILSLLLAPVVLVTALLYGSVKFKKMLII